MSEELTSASCTWTADGGYVAVTPDGEIPMFEDGGHRAVEVMLMSAASCLDFYLVEYAKERDLPVENISVECTGEVAGNPKRVTKIHTKVAIDGDIGEKETKKMVTMCERTCKVLNTLKKEPEVEVTIERTQGAQSRT